MGKHYLFCHNTSDFLLYSKLFGKKFLKKIFQNLKKQLWWLCEKMIFLFSKQSDFYLIIKFNLIFQKVWETSENSIFRLENWFVLQHKCCLLFLQFIPFRIMQPHNINKTGSVYPIPVLHAPYETCKTRSFPFSTFIGYVLWHSLSKPFLELHENFENPFQKILSNNWLFCWLRIWCL